MSLRKVITYTSYAVVCDSCGHEHQADTNGALEARIAAGVGGWAHESAKPGLLRRASTDARSAKATDTCPGCLAREETEQILQKERDAR